MKVLLANIHLADYGGTESWIYTMTHGLRNAGHKVEIYSSGIGMFAHHYLNEFRIYNTQPKNTYDVQIINHNRCLTELKNVPGYKILTSHSAIYDLERFIPGADKYVSISREIQLKEESLGFASTIINNPINCKRFYPQTPIHDTLKTVLYINKPLAMGKDIVKQACDELGVTFIQIDQPTLLVENYINQADCVVGLGRCLMEAMACGRNVVSGDYRQWMDGFRGGGMIEPDNFSQLREYNFSGRDNPIIFTVELLKQELMKYNPNYGQRLRTRMLAEYDTPLIINQYLSLYER